MIDITEYDRYVKFSDKLIVIKHKIMNLILQRITKLRDIFSQISVSLNKIYFHDIFFEIINLSFFRDEYKLSIYKCQILTNYSFTGYFTNTNLIKNKILIINNDKDLFSGCVMHHCTILDNEFYKYSGTHIFLECFEMPEHERIKFFTSNKIRSNILSVLSNVNSKNNKLFFREVGSSVYTDRMILISNNIII